MPPQALSQKGRQRQTVREAAFRHVWLGAARGVQPVADRLHFWPDFTRFCN
jgi:hypothetical protein